MDFLEPTDLNRLPASLGTLQIQASVPRQGLLAWAADLTAQKEGLAGYSDRLEYPPSLKGQPFEHPLALPARFGDQLELLGYSYFPTPTDELGTPRPQGYLYLTLIWRTLGQVNV
ncbi:MAG: hypothetical protein HYX89_06220, partial [Chloroflexi bacterium]|nr:hypothetical protein [Chloroflexota bacterium]